ncbi:hypothetical protein D869_gp021 [Caulobacter phage CcrRogue]|uniref:Uncharacterized protein n=1 Tax=Caulobacter phage CcrRogue TaxID=2927986 RepID=K4JS01_9CAUD|nr:hypothetical protein D869_gp021 [Caulobacter phage CcrRogue]AFU86503.1 hypothetical protein CcrRogue_gp021 [Caulobacter phage CcrRogue]
MTTAPANDILTSDPSGYALLAARETLAIALFSQKQLVSAPSKVFGGGGYGLSTWAQISPEQRNGWRVEADKYVTEQAGDVTAVTKDQKRNLEEWEREMMALADGHDPDGYFDAKDDRAGKTIAQHYRQEVPYAHKLTGDELLKAWETADKLGRHLPAFPTDYFDPVMAEKVARRQLTEWEAAIMAHKVGASISAWADYRFGVPFHFHFPLDDIKVFETYIVTPGGMVASVPAMTDADKVRYAGAWGKV